MPDGVIYMDHAGTTPTDPRVVEAMQPYRVDNYANASSLYEIGREAGQAVEEARAACAELIGAEPDEIYFTSGGTEGDNWALVGAMLAGAKMDRNELVVSSVEHHAVLETAEALERQGYVLHVVPVDPCGMVHPEEVKKVVCDKTAIVSIMHANNEVGTINPIDQIGEIAHAAGALFHSDTVQTVGKLPVDVKTLPVDMLTCSAHKLYGPKGVGFQYIRKGTRLERLMFGGSQERNKRAGTHNTPGIVGLGEACRLAGESMDSEAARLTALADKLKAGIEQRIPDKIYDGHPTRRLPGNVHFCFQGVEGEALLLCMDHNKMCVSSGSACTTGSLDPSHVLLAMGLKAEVAHGSVRFTLGHSNTEEQMDQVLEVLPVVVARMRAMSPTYEPGSLDAVDTSACAECEVPDQLHKDRTIAP